MTKTAMQEVLEKCQDESITLEELGKWFSMSVYMLLQKEKQQIIDAFLNGDDAVFHFCKSEDWTSANDYYNETYAGETNIEN